ncbi:MAG TPA: ABC transporter substrate-binding protein [Candidatus Nitrosocosmicus sp.]|jgi:ABC-type amino acid transport substrate-binding protein|nr:ABC transporter substrate-binding protein [Candidatus Nitrosocosmicus sp.]
MARIKRLTALALLASAGFCLWLLAPATFSDAHPQVSKLEKIAKSGKAAVCIWPEYYAISFKNPRTNELEGIDIDLARELAKELKAEIQWVETTFATFIPDLQTGKCDIGMFGLASSLARAQAVEFSRPYLVASSVGVTRKDHAKLKRWEDIDQKGIVVAVALGSVAEPLMRGYLKSATVLAVQPPATREQEVMAGRADILVTDLAVAKKLESIHPWARSLYPKTKLGNWPYAYAIAPGDQVWLNWINLFVETVKRDGRLATYAKKHGLETMLE